MMVEKFCCGIFETGQPLEAVSFKLRDGKEEDAAHLYEELVKCHGSIEALVGLITTVARVNIDKAEAYER